MGSVSDVGGYIFFGIIFVWGLAILIWSCVVPRKVIEDKSDDSDMASMFPEITPENEDAQVPAQK
ncbi:hypothetical protein TVAG_025860 [Trichomonas vaginalis G3]|uniref:Uncharacterized protein n=1 Tax=Trichomonas vaginalis (strain ATCC PRA-98 / G3) TaxID=412133 RepID=A2F0K8_TRIV3|nr:hypothetical protein TVAGG3_0328570 [Trichomonas vaginalis G3]EAY01588.1 hypothetical protein TVAG_025860 [Trichomonas vaginalis G3]KAI5529798.1 hypothetical protein TVAGG3_0328570 [Trichomonas vaginalis G3]|eukprot:XP_001314229.1 hypothetical protein [Trichomonas vaginalis G3]